MAQVGRLKKAILILVCSYYHAKKWPLLNRQQVHFLELMEIAISFASDFIFAPPSPQLFLYYSNYFNEVSNTIRFSD